MSRRLASWPDRVRAFIGHWLSEPFYRFFSLFPHWEVGLSAYEVTELKQTHPALAGRRAIHLSDLHIDRYQARHKRIVQAVSGLRPDWIVITGDLLNVPEGLPHLFRFLSGLRKIAPVFVTLGNHDHYSGVAIETFADWANRRDITLLINQTTYVETGAGELAIVGVDDPSLHRADLSCLPTKSDRRYTLLLAHAPNILDQMDDSHAADLILCGHSHGGQWSIPGIPTFWLPPGCGGRIAGPHETSFHRLYVNRGLGWSFLPFRWNCTPEIVVIDWASEQVQAKAA
ncbi:putative Metallophosphoesterase [Nitrospira sp. KM1]|uniref:metallophosphoesterase n=1 Tax=Nitrospira sp. KM1 TaxID=1936990 RepID=UPI0013A7B5B2|nr:metallophosphoesterase [Nitrospira sp. KM1]BCA55674.1 putative Metallophosphoesterase [Nitrospira sp. KM1]